MLGLNRIYDDCSYYPSYHPGDKPYVLHLLLLSQNDFSKIPTGDFLRYEFNIVICHPCSEKYKNKDFINALGDLLPQKLIPHIVARSGIPERGKVNEITREQRHGLASLIKGLTFTLKGLRPIDEAIVTSGGISVKEINPSTMESNRIKGLYFAGEIIDCDAYTGGFNLQIAWATAYAAAVAVSSL